MTNKRRESAQSAEHTFDAESENTSAIPREFSQTSKDYIEKHKYLSEYYNHILKSNNRLRNRIYHVKKEINHLKQLKRVLCERLLFYNMRIVDSNLEIPDTEVVGVDGREKNIKHLSIDTPSSAPPQTKRRKFMEAKKKEMKKASSFAEIQTKKNLMAIIDNIITETHEGSKALDETVQSNVSNSQSDTDQIEDELVDRLLRESSIDHLLPELEDPDESSSNLMDEAVKESSSFQQMESPPEPEVSVKVEFKNEEIHENALAKNPNYESVIADFKPIF
jgi:hypothetical protein